MTQDELRENAMREVQRLGQEIEQEPFAWFRYQQGSRVYYDTKKWDDCQPLYTTTPQRTWAGLTDEEIAQGCKESWVTELAFQSAVWWADAKLKEKNT